MSEVISGQAVADALLRICTALKAQCDYLTSLDQAMGDGDMGITLSRLAEALFHYSNSTPKADIGKFIVGAGMAANKAAPSTMGTLLATALMRAGKEVTEQSPRFRRAVQRMLRAAVAGMKERGKAQLGDKTVLDAFHPAIEALGDAVANGASLHDGKRAVAAAESGRDCVTPLRSRVGRAVRSANAPKAKLTRVAPPLFVMIKAVVE